MAGKTTAAAKAPRRSASVKSVRRWRSKVESVIEAANRFILATYPFGVLAGEPHGLELQHKKVWIVPIYLTSPGIGAVGQVGVLAIDDDDGAILGSTPREPLIAAGKRLCEENDDALEAAFLRARKKV